ncbi:MAG: glycosidase [Calditrichia bacterium]
MAEFNLKRVNGVILGPIPEHQWESGAVFNPGTVAIDETVHLLYRAVEGENYSTIGYARLTPEGKVLHREPEPVIKRTLPEEARGCEDPRIVPFEGKNYVFYTGYDGADVVMAIHSRIMLAETEDFLTYTKHGRIGPDLQDKDAMIFPERLDGKIAFLHRVHPSIQIAWFDDMEELIHPPKDYWEKHLQNLEAHTVMKPEFKWEEKKIGAGAPPIRTEAGWLMIYHGVDIQHVYRAGAVLLDERNPQKVIARLPYPILQPETDYEKYGDVDNVVFPEGVVVFDDELFVYYGAADKVIGLAAGSVKKLVDELWRHRI